MTTRFTLHDAYSRLLAGEAEHIPLARFLNRFYGASRAERQAMIADEPPLTGDPHEDAFAAGAAEYLAKKFHLDEVPDWVSKPERFLKEPWHVGPIQEPGWKEYLTFVSPAEFRARNIFTEERPLRRASMAKAKI